MSGCYFGPVLLLGAAHLLLSFSLMVPWYVAGAWLLPAIICGSPQPPAGHPCCPAYSVGTVVLPVMASMCWSVPFSSTSLSERFKRYRHESINWTGERSQGQNQVHSEPSFAEVQKPYIQVYTAEFCLRTNFLPEVSAVLYAVRFLEILLQTCLPGSPWRLELGPCYSPLWSGRN